MDTQTKKSGGTKILMIVLCVLLAVSLIFNAILYASNSNLSKQVTSLTDSNDDMTASLAAAQDAAAQAEADMATANETIDQLNTRAADADATLAALQAEYDAYQADVQTAQDTSDATITALQANIEELQAQLDALQAAPEETVEEEPAADAEEATDPEEEVVANGLFAADDVLATVNSEALTGQDVIDHYQGIVNYYGEPDEENVEVYYAAAMSDAITLMLIEQTAAELGLDQFTQEETDAVYATSDADWQDALDNYVSYYYSLGDDATDEDKATAYAEAEAYYGTLGYTKDSLRVSYMQNELYELVTDELCKDINITDEDVQAEYQTYVDTDKALYEFDIDAYETQILMYQYGYADAEPYYHPEGYRYIKHILLAVDDDLMTAYTDLLDTYESQQETDETVADEDVVTAEDVDAAKAAIIASVQAEIDEINEKLAAGESFDDLIAEYGTDSGMTSGSYPDGYEVAADSTGFISEFVTAAFSLENIGDVSEPFISEYGVHIAKYMGDVPGGPVELTDDMASIIREDLESSADDEVLNAWYDSADIEYTGILPSIEELQSTDDAE